MQMMNKNGFSRCAEFYIGRLRKEGRHSTAHVYKNAIFSFSKFCGTSNVSFRQVTRERFRTLPLHSTHRIVSSPKISGYKALRLSA